MGNFIFDFTLASPDKFKPVNVTSIIPSDLQVENQTVFTTKPPLSTPEPITGDPINDVQQSNVEAPMPTSTAKTLTQTTVFTRYRSNTISPPPKPLATESLIFGQPHLIWIIVSLSVLIALLLIAGISYVFHRRHTSK